MTILDTQKTNMKFVFGSEFILTSFESGNGQKGDHSG